MFRSNKTPRCELNSGFILKRVFIPISVGDYEAITAELEKIECKELREKLVSPFAIHMNRKDYASNDRKIFNEKIRPKINSIIAECFKMT
jgi:hypothetical protein